MSQKKEIIQNIPGFTLVELLISTFLLLAISSVVMTIFVAGLRGSNRSSIETDIQRNGDFAITQVTRMIRNARSFDGVSTDGTTFSSSCFASGDPTPTPAVYKYVKVTAFDGGTTILGCPDTGQTAITSQSASLATPFSLTDSSSVRVDPESCYFSCEQDSATDLPSISLGFRVESIKSGGLVGKTTAQTFETTVVPRNFFR